MFRLLIVLTSVVALSSCSTPQNKLDSGNDAQQNHCGKSDSKECCCCRDGRDGRDGHNGIQGIRGIQGIQGPQGVQGKDGRDGRDGRNGAKGEKGESCVSAERANTAGICARSIAGAVRYNASQNALEWCNGKVWLPVVIGGKGLAANQPGRHCLDILKSGHGRGNGLYWIDPNGGSTDDSFQAFCDMETEGGGWTLISTKVSSSFIFIKTTFSASAAKTTDADAASHIHPNMGDWEEVMFRFSDVSTIRVIYSRKASAPNNNDKTDFEKFLTGTTYNKNKNIHGFYKYSPADHNNRNPSSGFATISKLHFYSKYGISEVHDGTDKWINMWHSAQSSNNFVTSDDRLARGTKCIAGYCYLNKPIWVMVR